MNKDNFDDTTLIAYLDGQLPEADYAPLEQALAEDADLQARLQALAHSSELARRSFDPVLLEPVPPSLIAAIWQAPDPRAHGGRSLSATRTPGSWSARLLQTLGLALGHRNAWPAAFASVLVAGVAAVVGWQWLAGSPGDAQWALQQGTPVAEPALAQALETAPSGRVLATASGDSVELLASFAPAAGGHCREFHRSNADRSQDELGIACRSSAGVWQLDFLAAEQRPAASGNEAGYQTAGNRQHEAAEAFLRERAAGPALTEAEERALLERRWARP